MNSKNCIGIATNSEYITKVSGVRYGLNVGDMTSPKNKDKA